MNYRIYVGILGLCFALCQSCEGQTVSGVIAQEVGNTIQVDYKLHGLATKKYVVGLYCSQNDGATFTGPLKMVSGNAGPGQRVGAGRIIWDVLKEEESLIGSLVFEVRCSEQLPADGPGNAFLSVMVPGWGKSRVLHGNGGWESTAFTYTCLGTAGLFKLVSNGQYNKYHSDNTQEDMDKHYKNANGLHKTALIFAGAGVVTWVCDVVWVAVRGAANRRGNSYTSLFLDYDPNSNVLLTGVAIMF